MVISSVATDTFFLSSWPYVSSGDFRITRILIRPCAGESVRICVYHGITWTLRVSECIILGDSENFYVKIDAKKSRKCRDDLYLSFFKNNSSFDSQRSF